MKKNLKLTQIRIDGGTQARAGLDQATVAEYSEHMKEGAKFPAPVVYFDGSNYWMADGFHRYFANKTNGVLEIECDIKEGTQRDAKFYSLGANGGRGLKLKSEDIKNILHIIFADEEWGDMSSTAIAKHIGVSVMTVTRARHAWNDARADEEAPEAEDEGEDEEEVTYTNKHGQKAKMKVGKVGKKAKELAPKVETPHKMTPEEELSQKLMELEDQLKETIDENEKLKDAVAVGQFDGEEIEKIDLQDTLNDLREQIRIKDIEIQSLRESRDTYQNRAAELMKQVKALQAKLKKAGIE